MKHALRIAVADDEPDMREFYERMLTHMGYAVVGAAETGQELLSLTIKEKPDLVITDIRMPDMDGIEAANAISKVHAVPIILVSAYHDDETIERAEQDQIMAYLVKPIQEANLETAIAVAKSRFESFQKLQAEAGSLRQALADRKVIERAKGILMKRAGLAEADAFRRLQKLSWDKNQKLIEIAQLIITADQVLEPPGPSEH